MTPTDDHAATLDHIIEHLRSARGRQRMYLETVDVPAAQNFLTGFRVASAACGFDLPLGFQARATVGRGWAWSAAGTVGPMRERGLTEAAVVDELFAIEVAAWEAWRDGPS